MGKMDSKQHIDSPESPKRGQLLSESTLKITASKRPYFQEVEGGKEETVRAGSKLLTE